MERPYFVVDAFASEAFTGNAAAVLPDASGLDDRLMAKIAAEFNLSETTFVLPASSRDGNVADETRSRQRGTEASRGLKPAAQDVLHVDSKDGEAEADGTDLHVRFRWFTPGAEVDMCGHATIAGVHALVECGRMPDPADETSSTVARIETRSGTLTAYVERIPGSDSERMIWLDLIDPTFSSVSLDESELAAALGLPTEAFERHLPVTRTQDSDLLVFVRDIRRVNEAMPDFNRLANLLRSAKLRGLSLATINTLTPSIHVQSRFFAPAVGINEDPVTGSVHGPLAAYVVKHGVVAPHDGLAAMTCVQGVAGGRTGLLHALVQPQGDDRFAVRIGGRAVTTMRGTLFA